MDYNGDNYDLSQNEPKERARAGEIGGRVRHIHETITLAAGVLINEKILGPMLPEGALVLDAYIKSTAMGGAGDLSLGHEASEDGSEAADVDAFINAADASAASVLQRPTAHADEVGINKRFSKPVQLSAHFRIAPTTSLAVVVHFEVFYSYD